MAVMFGLTGIWKYLVIGLAALALIAVIVVGVRGCKQINSDNTNTVINSGVAQQKAADQGEVLNHVQAAHDATTNPTDAERNVVCSKYDRNCKASGGK